MTEKKRNTIIEFVAVVVILLISSISFAEDPDMKRKSAFYFEGVFAERMKLRSGIVRVELVWKTLPGMAVERKDHYVIAFDLDENLLYYRQLQKEESYCLIRNEKSTFFQSLPDGIVEKHDVLWNRPIQSTAPVDVRCLGISGPGYFLVRQSFDELKRETLARNFTAIDESGDGKVEIVNVFKTSPDSTNVKKASETIDLHQGFAPVKGAVVSFDEGKNEDEELRSTSETTWKKINGIWLPQVDINRQIRLNMEFIARYDWEHVNRPIDKKWFSLEGMEISDGALLADFRLEGTPIIEGQFLDGKLQLTGEAALAAAAEEARTATARRMFRIRMFLMAVGFVMIAIAVYWKIKEFRERQSKGLPKS